MQKGTNVTDLNYNISDRCGLPASLDRLPFFGLNAETDEFPRTLAPIFDNL